MAIQQREDLKLPPDETVIWRYMDLPKMLLLLEEGALYFAAITELGDSWEAVMARRLRESVLQTFGGAQSDATMTMLRTFPRHFGVNCWYEGRDESIAMWNLYTTKGYGVALKSTVGRLKKALDRYPQEISLGQVLYEEHEKKAAQLVLGNEINADMPLFQKRPCFKHEHEIRAVTLLPLKMPVNAEPGKPIFVPFPERGSAVWVELELLVESITLGPDFWATSLLESALARAGIAPPIVKSKILEPPDAELRAF